MAGTREILALVEIHKNFGTRRQTIGKIKTLLSKNAEALIEQLTESDYALLTSSYFSLTEKGLREAQKAERAIEVLKIFCQKILGLTARETQEYLPELFAGITPALLERYCTLIGHGYSHNITTGACCSQAKLHNAETVITLSRLPVGVAALVVYVQTSQRPELLKLYELGIHPGQTIRIQQLYPAYIVATEQSRLALDSKLARFIFVQRT